MEVDILENTPTILYKKVTGMAIYFPTYYRVLSFLLILMAYSITTNTRFAGSTKGAFLNDPISRMSFPPLISSRF